MTFPVVALLRHPLTDDPRTTKVLGYVFATMCVGVLYCVVGVRVRRGRGGPALALLAAGFAAVIAIGSVAMASSLIFRARPDELLRLSAAISAPSFVGIAASAIAINRLAAPRADADAPRRDAYDDVVSAAGVFLVATIATLALTVMLVAMSGQ